MAMPASQIGESHLLQPPRFRLRTLFWLMTALGMMFGIMSLVGAVWATALGLLVLLVGLHVAGNALGTQLHGGPRTSDEPLPSYFIQRDTPWQPPLATRIQQRQPLPRMMLLLGAVGAATGGALGGTGLTLYYSAQMTVGAAVIATLASGVIGALGFFLAGSFLGNMLHALREAGQ